MRIVLMGPPGAGKGTQAKRLAAEFGMRHLSSGDILRAEKASGSELGGKLAQYMNAGALVPDEIVVDVMAKALTSGSADVLLDGFPRTVPQAEALDRQLANAGKPLDDVVVILVEDDSIVDRITGRRTCPKCGRIYHVKHLAPRRAGACDDDGTALVQRDDDTEAVVRNRLATYHRQTEPVVGYYRTATDRPVIEVDGSAAPDEVGRRLVLALRQRG